MTTPANSQAEAASKLLIPASLMAASKHRRFLWIVLGLAVLVVGAVSWAALARPARAIYRTEALARRTIVRDVEALGYLDVPERIELPAPTPGRLVKILVSPGQTVRRGQLLAQLDESTAALSLGAARASLRAGDSRIAEASASFESALAVEARTARLTARGLASEADMQTARGAAARARAELQGARAERAAAANGIAAAALQKELTAIRAPSDGVVLAAPDRVGAAVAPETGRLFVLGSSMDVMRIRASVAEADVADVQPAQAARFTVPAFPGRSFEARVLRVDPDAQRERSSVTYEVTLETVNRSHLLLPGMSASVRIEAARAENVLAVREAALRFVPRWAQETGEESRRSRLWRLGSRRRPESVPVVAGISDGAYTEVRGQGGVELRTGEEIVIGLLSPGEPKSPGPGLTLGRR